VTQRQCWYLLLIFLLALATRAFAVSFFLALPVSDALDYHRLAISLSQGHGYVDEAGAATAWRPPGYPLFLAAIYKVFGAQYKAAYYIQALLGSLAALLLFVFAMLTIGRKEAFVAALLAAVYPGFFWLPRILLSENLAMPLSIAALCAAALFVRTHLSVWACTLGVLLGFSVLVRGSNLLFAAFLLLTVLMLLSKKPDARKSYLQMSLAPACLLLVMLPWTARNYQIFHRLIPVANQDGLTLYASYWPPQVGSKRIWGNVPGAEDPVVAKALRATDEVETSNQLRSVTLNRLREEPLYVVELWPSKLLYLLAPFDWEWFPHRPGTTRSVNIGYCLLFWPACVGICVLRQRRLVGLIPQEYVLMWVLPASVIVQSLIFYGSPRFRLPAETTLVLLASVGIVWMLQMTWKKARSEMPRGRELSNGVAPSQQDVSHLTDACAATVHGFFRDEQDGHALMRDVRSVAPPSRCRFSAGRHRPRSRPPAAARRPSSLYPVLAEYLSR
jgi:4-amino-4-deoxy-L-arabinose transferase-like glycosyltransferase